MMFARFLQFIRHLFARPIPPATIPPCADADLPFKFSPDGDPIRIEFDGMVLTFGTIELGERPFERIYDLPGDSIKTPTYYRDEDGEVRPVRQDSTPLADMALEDLAAEFLRARSDADATPDPLEREITAALRDAYGRELWRRATNDGLDKVTVGGRRYRIVVLPAVGQIHLLAIE